MTTPRVTEVRLALEPTSPDTFVQSLEPVFPDPRVKDLERSVGTGRADGAPTAAELDTEVEERTSR